MIVNVKAALQMAGLGLILAQIVSGNSRSSAERCTCVNVCQAIGDPHITSFNGVDKKWDGHQAIQLYKNDDFIVTLYDTGSDENYISNVTFSSESDPVASIQQCQKNYQNLTAVKTFDSGDVLNVTAQCIYKGSGGYHLNVYLQLTLIQDGSAATTDFEAMQRNIDQQSGGGVCVNQDRRRRLRSLSDTYEGTCTCQSECQITGDPEYYSFYMTEDKKITTPGNLTFYALDNYNITGFVDNQKGRVTDVYVENGSVQQHLNSATACGSNPNGEWWFNNTFSDGGVASTLVKCFQPTSDYFFDTYVYKTDPGVGLTTSTFQSLETSTGSTGLCVQS